MPTAPYDPNGLKERMARIEAMFEERYSGLDRLMHQRFADLDKALSERASASKVALDAALLAAKEAVQAALAAAKEAVKTAYEAQAIVNEKQNEFRQALVDQQITFLPRETFETAGREIARRLENLEASTNLSGGRTTGIDATKALGFAVLTAFGTVIGIVVAILATSN